MHDVFMTKDDLRSLAHAAGDRPDILHWFSSSGTTGTPVVYPWSASDEQCAYRALERIHPATDRMPGQRGFIIAPTGLPSMWSHMGRQLRFMGCSTVFPGVESFSHLLSLLALLRPAVLASLPIALARLGEIWRLSQALPDYHPEVLFVGGDVLSDARRRRLSTLWNATVRNFYGMSEVFGPLASESSEPGVMRWHVPDVRVEVLHPETKQPVPEGETGVAVFTTQWERPAKLVRYWTGDLFRLVAWIEPGCPAFVARGREGIRLPGLMADCQPVDIDDILLSDPNLATEWSAEKRAEDVAILCESPGGKESVDPRTLRHLQSCFCAPVRLEVVSPGTLNHSRNKLGQPELGRYFE